MLDKLPVSKLEQELEEFVAPLVRLLPDRWLGDVIVLAVPGKLAGERPMITQLAKSVARDELGSCAAAGRIKHGYRFDQEQGLDAEDIRVQTLERMRKLFAWVLVAAQFVYCIQEQWPPQAVHWLRQLGASYRCRWIGTDPTSCCEG